jgi:hypothetical protein
VGPPQRFRHHACANDRDRCVALARLVCEWAFGDTSLTARKKSQAWLFEKRKTKRFTRAPFNEGDKSCEFARRTSIKNSCRACAKDFMGTPYCSQIKDQGYARSFLEPVV